MTKAASRFPSLVMTKKIKKGKIGLLLFVPEGHIVVVEVLLLFLGGLQRLLLSTFTSGHLDEVGG